MLDTLMPDVRSRMCCISARESSFLTRSQRRVYLFSWIPFCFAQLGAWFARNSVQMLAFRLIAGTAGSAPLTGGGGGIRSVATPATATILNGSYSDMFAPRERAYAMSLYTMMPFMGPILGPLIGGAIAEKAGWRRIFVVLFCFAAVLAIVAIVNMRETVRRSRPFKPLVPLTHH